MTNALLKPALVAAIAFAPLVLAPAGVPFEKAARDFMAQHGLADKRAEEVDFESVLKGHFVVGRFGAFEVYFPVASLERRAGDFRDCVLALVGAQEKLADWNKPAGHDQKALRADIKLVTDWIKGWRVPAKRSSPRPSAWRPVSGRARNWASRARARSRSA